MSGGTTWADKFRFIEETATDGYMAITAHEGRVYRRVAVTIGADNTPKKAIVAELDGIKLYCFEGKHFILTREKLL